MRVHFFQHVPFEGPGLLAPWLLTRGHEQAFTRWWAGDPVPSPADYDWLIVLGGPMNVYQDRDYPWLPSERAAVAAALASRRRVLGICLGAQLIADALGARVVQNPEREIGWWPLEALPLAPSAPEARFALPPGERSVLHWHGDTFTPPPGATRLAASRACAWQAFAAGPRVLGLQFHVEMDPATLANLAAACAAELPAGGPWVQSAARISEGAPAHAAACAALLDHFLAALERG